MEVRLAKVKQLPQRQRVRKGLLFISLLLLPITLYYLSPYIITASAAEGVVNGSAVAFALMFLSSLLVGRLWCGWLCPAGALQEYAAPVNNKRTSPRLNWGKWVVWIPWISIILLLVIRAGGYHSVNVFYMLEGGVTLTQEFWYMMYYIVVVVLLVLAFLLGRRAACHAICWMAPFMILGRKLRNAVGWSALHLKAEKDKCIDCGICTAECTMSLDVNQMVKDGRMEHSECVLCGNCVDVCPKDVLHYAFSRRSE
jgi:ferredoxin-type protein NapH